LDFLGSSINQIESTVEPLDGQTISDSLSSVLDDQNVPLDDQII